jgi:hypothetical protein
MFLDIPLDKVSANCDIDKIHGVLIHIKWQPENKQVNNNFELASY